MIGKLIRLIRGYLKIIISGTEIERFLNICSKKGVNIWNLQCIEGSYELNIYLKDFRNMKNVIKKTYTQIIIKERYGLPFFLFKCRKKKFFFIGIALFLLINYILSLRIWDIELDGSYSYTEYEIIECLKENSIYHGITISNISCNDIEKLIRNKYYDITWVSAEIKGTRLIVHIKENFDDYIVKNETDPYDLISSKSGTIVSIITRAGTPLVKPGAIVNEGDILVSGTIQIFDDNLELKSSAYVNADSDIFIDTSYEYSDTLPISHIVKDYTGKEEHFYQAEIVNGKISSIFSNCNYEKYDQIAQEYQLKLLNNFFLPVRFWKITCKEYTEHSEDYTEEEASEILNSRLNVFLQNLQEKGIQIISNSVKIGETGANYEMSGSIRVIEQTGVPSTINIDEGNTATDEHN